MNIKQQHLAALRRAVEAGDAEAADEIAAELERLEGPHVGPADAVEFDPTDAPLNIRVPGTDIGFDVDAPQGVTDFMIGAGKGAVDVGRGVQDAWHRLTGDYDALARLTDKAEAEDAHYRRNLGDSLAASAGHIAGQVASTLPLGGAVAGLGRGAVAVGHTGRLAVAEGALTEGLTQRGDFGERAAAAAVGAAGGAVGDLAVKAGGRVARGVLSRRDPQGLKAAAAAREAEIDQRVEFARESGGYTLDRADASLDDIALREREAARIADTSGKFAEFRAMQEADIKTRAVRLVDEDFRHYIGEGGAIREDAADLLADVLLSERRADDAAVTAAYDAWARASGDEPLDVAGLGTTLDDIISDIPYADKATGDRLREMLGGYGLGAEPGGPRFTPGMVERVRRELNAFHSAGRRDVNSAIGKLKHAIDDHVASQVDSLSADGARAVELGRRATELARENFQKWDSRTFLGKATELGPDGESLRNAPQATLRRLLSSDDRATIEGLKLRMAGSQDPDVKRAWKKIAAVPIVEALHAATRATGASTDMLNISAFKAAIDRIPPKKQQSLWGLDGADEIQRAISAWGLHAKRPSARGAISASGTAEALHSVARAGARMVNVPGIGGAVLGLLQAGKGASSALRSGRAEINAARLASGRLTVEAERRQARAMKQALIEAYGAPEMMQYNRIYGWLARALVREGITPEDL